MFVYLPRIFFWKGLDIYLSFFKCSKPNILFLVIDSFRADKFSGSNKSSLTPNIDKIANVPQNLQLRNWENGETIFNQSFKSMLESKSSSYLLINRYDLLNILRKKFGERKIIYGATCKKISLKNNKVTLTH